VFAITYVYKKEEFIMKFFNILILSLSILAVNTSFSNDSAEKGNDPHLKTRGIDSKDGGCQKYADDKGGPAPTFLPSVNGTLLDANGKPLF